MDDLSDIKLFKEDKDWIAERNETQGRGDTKKSAIADLLETEMFIRIASHKKEKGN